MNDRLQPGPIGRHRILVVEDDTQHSKVIRTALGVTAFDVRTAADAPTAVRILLWFQPELILIDIDLTRTDGLQLIRVLRRDMDETKLPVVAITAYSKRKDRALAVGCLDCIPQPLDTLVLPAQVQAFLEGRPYEAVALKPAPGLGLELVRNEFRTLAGTLLQGVVAGLPQSQNSSASRHTLRQLAATAAFLNWKDMVEDLQFVERLTLAGSSPSEFGGHLRTCIQKLEA